MGSAVERTDEHVREYLIYRGFTNTLRQLDGEIKADKEKGFRVRLCHIIHFFSSPLYFFSFCSIAFLPFVTVIIIISANKNKSSKSTVQKVNNIINPFKSFV